MWKPGESGNPQRRPKDSRNKLGEDFVRMVCEDFEQHGAAVIATVRELRPQDYLKIVVAVVPKQIEMDNEGLTVIVRTLSEDKEPGPAVNV
jgi:hypothetical protein